MSQRFSLYDDLTVEENIEFYSGIYRLPAKKQAERRAWVLEMAGLKGREKSLPRELSGGWKQRLALGCAILHEPRILFLDEPTAGVDPLSRRRFWDLIASLSEQGTTVFVTTHYMDEAEHCHRLALINQGRLVALGSPRELKQNLLARAEPVLGVPADALTIRAGQILGPDRSIGVKELLWQGDLVPVTVMVSRRPEGTRTGVPYIASFAEVEVDTSTGRTQVVKIVVINDCGTVMYASGAEAQQVGGQVMAIGEALTEEIVYDPVRGLPLNFNLIDYKIPTIADMPPIEPVLLEVWRGAGEYGACGIGEGTLTCTPRAIAIAVYNAIGVRVDELPLTPEKVLHALGKI
jgi:hypothetical protein